MAGFSEFGNFMECERKILSDEDFEKCTSAYNAYDWRSKCKNVVETLVEARNKSKFVDVLFFVGQSPPSARFFRGHKIVLACGSSVFEAMFFGQLADKQKFITLPDDDPEAFEIMLQCLYGECMVFPSIPVACKSYSIGDKYLITELKKKSTDFIKTSTMNEEDFWGVIEGNLLNNKCINEKFCRYIQVNAGKLVKSDQFLNVPEYIVKFFLQLETINVSEFELLMAVSKWYSKKFSKDSMEKTRDFLQYIRFSVLTPKEYCIFTENFPEILDTLTSLKIVKHLIDKVIYNLPEWCSTKTVVRKSIEHSMTPLNSNCPIRPPYSRRCTIRKEKISLRT